MYQLLACPHEGDERSRRRLLDLIEPVHAHDAVRAFVRRHEAALDASTSGVCALIEDWCAHSGDFNATWVTPLCEVYGAARDDATDVVRGATAVACHASSTGREGAWQATLPEPARLRWGRYLLPASTSFAIEFEHGVARVESATGNQRNEPVTFANVEGSWEAEGARLLPGVGGLAHPILLDAAARPPGRRLPGDVSDDVLDSVTSSVSGAFLEALQVLSECAPLYRRWVDEVVRDIIVLEGRTGRTRSGSNRDWPGLLYLSNDDPVVLAENLVHEASHQYFNLLMRVDDVDDGSNSTLYYSPPTRRDRPLWAIAMAYHAFANVALFLESCVDFDGDCLRRAARFREVLEWVDRLQRPIACGAGLSTTGKALTRPLVERMGALLASRSLASTPGG